MGALLFTLACALFAPVREANAPLLESLAWAFAFIVIGYYGNNAIESFSKGRK
jgi:uncharacterized MAPEG superfamily protein